MMGTKNRTLGVIALALALLWLGFAGIAAATNNPFIPDSGSYANTTIDPQDNDVLGLGSYFGEAKAVECQKMTHGLDWLQISLAALGTGIFIAAAGYVLGGLLGTPQYNAFVKNQLWGVIEGAVILGIFTATVLVLSQVGEQNLGTARAYSVIIKNTSAMNFGMVMVANTVMTFFAKQTPQPKIPGLEGFYLGFQMSPMFRPVFDAMGMVTQLITVSVVEWTAHEFLLCFIQNSMLTLLLPAGIFLRIFGFKNGANALIGLALALYFIYPWMMVLIGDSITTYFQEEIDQLMNGRSQTKDFLLCAGRPICCMPEAPTASAGESYIQNGRD
ncbi:MAG: hypothetical protein NT051_02005, partial [Candidatus Micrarchaeota archaeon]|nr:hypothetical protein [Candidatus Micrarchaeota archaeon]